ncbi:MAG: hypothetical protein ABI130_02050 [Leifsonia sp.]
MTSPTTPSTGAFPSHKTWRRVAVIAVVASFSISALVGIVSLLSGSFGAVQGQILVTTAVVGTFSGLALCQLAAASTPFRVVGAVGLAASIVALLCALGLIWGQDTSGWANVWRTYGVSSIVAFTAAQASLLLRLGRRRHPAVRGGLWATLATASLLALLLILPIVTSSGYPSDYARWVGAVAILDVLGTIVVPVLGALLKDAPSSDRPVGSPAATTSVILSVLLPQKLVSRLDAFAQHNGLTRESAIERILEAATAERA